MSSRNGKSTSKKGLAALDGLGSLADLDTMGSGFDGLADLEEGAAPVVDHLAGVDYDGATNEEAMQQETSAVLAAFKQRAKSEQERFLLATDSEYWVGVCFQTREQKEHFLREAKLLQAGDKYIDGALVAKRLGITLPPAQVPYNISAKVDAKYAALVKDL